MILLDPGTRSAWRTWLEEHHAEVSEVWLVFHKTHTGRKGVSYEDAVEEAVCFGWVDSLVKRIDEDRYARKFTPRRAGSVWSESNRNRLARMLAAGRMAQAGLEAAGFETESASEERPAPPRAAEASGLPAKLRRAELPPQAFSDEITELLRAHGAAWRAYCALPPSHQKRYAGWIMSAKRRETRLRRLEEAIERLERGERLGLK